MNKKYGNLTPKDGQVFGLTAKDPPNRPVCLKLQWSGEMFLGSKIVLQYVLLLKFQTLTLSIVVSLTISKNHLTITAIVVT